jgi:glyoxylase-like metal-dependent hydrolase (beta-lactamase superfamily II)
MIFQQIPTGKMQNFTYLFADSETGEGMIIDPAFDAEKIMQVLKEYRVNLQRIILTHHHYDHVNAAQPIKARTGAEIFCHPETVALLKGEASHDRLIHDKDQFKLGNAEVKCLHTPGHAPGSLCLIVNNKWLVTGDTLFIGDCGRADLPGGSLEELYNSMQKIKKLNKGLIVCPGHNYGKTPLNTLGEEMQSNPVLKANSLTEFMQI